jgi:CO/xanthine dehydrogenase FAD-binding subunit
MRPFTYERATDSGAAVTAVSRAGAKYISGGTNLLDLMSSRSSGRAIWSTSVVCR